MNTTSMTATVAAIPSVIILTIIGLFIWHWLDTDAGAFDSVKMTFQDVKVALSCHNMETSWQYAGRTYDDYLYDRPVNKLPSGNTFICRLYEKDRFRTPKHRVDNLDKTFQNLPAPSKARVQAWINEEYDSDSNISFKTYIEDEHTKVVEDQES